MIGGTFIPPDRILYGNTLLMVRKKEEKKDRFLIKLRFNPDLPLDAEIIKTLKQQTNMTAYIKFALYHYITNGETEGSLNEPDEMLRGQVSLHKEGAVSPGKEKMVHQWDKDAAFADAFEPLK